MTDGGMAVYSGTPCGVLTLISCDDDSSPNGLMPKLTLTGQTPGSTLYIRVWEYGNNNNGTFGICVTTAGPCGNPSNNDYCSNPAQLTQGAGTFSSTTSSIYSSDTPGNINSAFCGSIENNSWYQFTASATTATFPITSVSGCTNGWGIQAQVYSVTSTTAGCCSAFTSVSNCFNPGTSSTGTVTATGLTVGQKYILMIDGNAGDVCNFTISGWTATGILPIELVDFTGNKESSKVLLNWITASETNNDYFTIERSKDGVNFYELEKIKSKGNSASNTNYISYDNTPIRGINYYRLKQTDFDGTFKFSKIISVDFINETKPYKIYPNPSYSGLFTIYTTSKAEFEIYDSLGKLITFDKVEHTDEIYLGVGIYYVRIKVGNKVYTEKITSAQ